MSQLAIGAELTKLVVYHSDPKIIEIIKFAK